MNRGNMTAFGLAAALCLGSAASGGAASTTGKVTIYHWWTSPSDAAAIAALVDVFEKKHPGVKVRLETMGRAGVRWGYPTLRQLVVDQQPFDAFQLHAGYAAQLFHDADFLDPLDELWADDKLEKAIPPLIQDLCRIDGHYYSVPINVHRTNVVWFNKPLLEKNKIDPASLTTWEAFFKAAETLQAAKVPFPIQMGTTWTATHVFECILASLGMKTYEDWLNGAIDAPNDPRLVKALSTFGRYLTYVNSDHADLGWETAIQRVIKGESAFCILGDWVNGEFRRAEMKYGRDYGTFLVPETKGMYGVDVDTFARPRGISEPLSSNRWLSVVGSRAGQDAFNPLKSSIPARLDADLTLSGYDPYQRSAIADFKTAAHLYPNSVAALPEGFNNQANDILVLFMADKDVRKAASALVGLATRFKTKGMYRRVWSLK